MVVLEDIDGSGGLVPESNKEVQQQPGLPVVVMDATEQYPPQVFTSIPALGALWKFPSDHIPVAARIGDLTCASFNVLNARYVFHLEDNKQGLADSEIISESVPLQQGSSWTRRDEKVLEITLDLVRRTDVVCLQECSPEFLNKLSSGIPRGSQLFTGRSDTPKNQAACVVNCARVSLDVAGSLFSESAYACRPDYSAKSLKLTTPAGHRVQVFHSHVPGDPHLPGLLQFGEFIKANRDPGYTAVVIGDLNFPEATVRAVFSKLALPDFRRLVDGNTSIGNLGSEPVAKDLDHILLFEPDTPASALLPSEISDIVAAMHELINRG